MSWGNGKILVDSITPGPLIRITIEDTKTGDPICMIEMQPEEFALAITKNGSRRCKYLDIYKKTESEETL